MVIYDPWDRFVPGDIVVDRRDGMRMTFSHFRPVEEEMIEAHCHWFRTGETEDLSGDFALHELELENVIQISYKTLIEGESQEIEHGTKFRSRTMADTLALMSDDFHAVGGFGMIDAVTDKVRHALAEMTEPWVVLYFHREKTAVAFFRNLTEAVQFKLLIV